MGIGGGLKRFKGLEVSRSGRKEATSTKDGPNVASYFSLRALREMYFLNWDDRILGLAVKRISRRDRRGATNAKRDSYVATYFSLRALREMCCLWDKKVYFSKIQYISHIPVQTNASKPLFRLISFPAANSFTFFTKLKSLMMFFILLISSAKILSSSAKPT